MMSNTLKTLIVQIHFILFFNNLDAYTEKDGEDKYLVIAKTHSNGSF